MPGRAAGGGALPWELDVEAALGAGTGARSVGRTVLGRLVGGAAAT